MNLKSSLALGCCLLIALLLSDLLVRFPPQQALAVQDWTLTEFLHQLQEDGVQLHVVGRTLHQGPLDQLYLTEDPDATPLSVRRKMRIVERIHQWQGTVWVGHFVPGEDVEAELADWGPYGCQIGNLLLFGDERLLQRIQAACR